MISGHRRLHAAQKAGLETVPAFVHPIDRDAAAIELVDSDLHREHILPSEKAFAYKLKSTALLFAPLAVFANRKFFREITNGLILRSARLLLSSILPSSR